MAEDTLLQEAIEALKRSDRLAARELLTRLLKADPNNVDYWLWLSAAVETRKERLYCLQTVLKLDPQNQAAKRGLVLLGALPADESVPPFPLNHPRLWEEHLTVSSEQKPKGLRAAWARPGLRLLILLGISGLVISLVMLGLYGPRAASTLRTHGFGLFGTFTPTPTYISGGTRVVRTPTPTFIGPTPLWMMLPATYTPTPLYVVTEHSPASSDSFSAGIRFFNRGEWENAISMFEQVTTNEPAAVDTYFYIGESYRSLGEYSKAIQAYEHALSIQPGFAPCYYGRALARHAYNPEINVLADFNRAIELDPDFPLAYIERAVYLIELGRPEAALNDLEIAHGLIPDSPLVYLYSAEAYLGLGENAAALQAAQQANQKDITLLPAYLLLGRAYQANGRLDEAVGALQTYTLYRPLDGSALVLLGSAYNAAGDYLAAIEVLDRALALDKTDAEAYYQRGLAYLNLGQTDLAEADLKKAVAYNPNDFDANLALGRTYLLQGHPGDAYLQIVRNTHPLADNDREKAQVYYWQALTLEQMQNDSADAYWRYLLNLPEQAVPPEWRLQAMQHLGITPTPTLSSTPTSAATP